MSFGFSSAYADLPVVVTGHSGFKGSWLTAWLARLGASVTGISLPPDQGPDNLFERAEIGKDCTTHWTDIRDAQAVARIMQDVRPKVIFHLAAQPLVQRSYREPLLTFETNIMGAANVLEAARHCDSVEAVVFVTSDKVYDNREWVWAYREADRLGGLDPYSASKSAAEIVARTYMEVLRGPGEGYRLATARGGNVVGGGDWSENRIVPDIVRSLRAGDPLVLRHPEATRPWQHVLELCAGYLTLGACLLHGRTDRGAAATEFTGAWNFGPERTNEMSVRKLVDVALATWGKTDHPVELGHSSVHESTYLRVDSSKSQARLGWQPALDFEQTIAMTVDWYRQYVDKPDTARRLVEQQIESYTDLLGRTTR
ncbi:CDP-glucose 4,6-dehydratase [Hartmannibacter diazotrophicus]|uniref:CDP-glucose 4,6-dehydratase n=1 Tax=Hartmannibacter diazotrophicus TaxID=1482074 RepID=A0A2C9D4K3_9HYPH|nr:CDP-glucose 4,6-dehydratase [Hartmannibacter diazotrophicus]SON54425.1 CDP-glucose 4,6-dehydratase [Hartmannibacter diazotrophicus]